MLDQLKHKKCFVVIIIITLTNVIMFIGCDCRQQAQGLILDRKTKIAIDHVTISTSDITQNTVPGKLEHSDLNGEFKFDRISGGIRKCPDLTLYFFKPGYKQRHLTFDSFSKNDTVYLDKADQ